MGFIKEFRDFAVKGNLVDIALAFVMGAAFGKVVTAFTEGVIAPVIGLIGGKDLSNEAYVLEPAETDSSGKIVTEAISIKWGAFVTEVISFILVALVMFIIVKAIIRLKKKEEAAPTPPDKTEVLLTEIRDELKKG